MHVVNRCSSLPMLLRCPGAGVAEDGVLVSPYIEAATTGTDVHWALAKYPDGAAPAEVIAELDDDARILFYTGAKMWRDHISAWMPDSDSESAVGSDYLTGHIDRLSVSPDLKSAVILDWKSGRKDSDYSDQGFGYAHLAFDNFPRLETCTVHFAWLRTKEVESYTVSRARSEEWLENYKARVLGWDGVFHPGEHCVNCPRQSSCPALRQVAKQSVAIFQSGSMDLASMSSPELVGFYARVKTVAKLVGIADAALGREVKARGDVEDGDGGVLHYVEEEGPRTVDTYAAWPVLTKELNDKELAGCLRVGLGKVEAAIAAKAPRGKAAGAKRELAKALEAAGAVTREPITKLRHDRRK